MPGWVLHYLFYNSLPPVSKAYGTLCLLTTTAYQLGLLNPVSIALIYDVVISRFQVWSLITNFFFLGKFSINFGIRLLMMHSQAISPLRSPFLGVSLVFMLLCVWSREFPNAQISIYGLVTLKAFYLPWAMLALDVIFGSPLTPDLLGIIAGHLFYFLTVLQPLAGERNILKTPIWVHKLVAMWGLGGQANAPVQLNRSAGVAFRGRSYRLDG